MLDLIILVLLGRSALHRLENTKAVKETAAFTCNTVEGKPFNYDFLGKPLGRLFRKLERSVKLCAALIFMLCALTLLIASGLLFSMTDSVLQLLHTVVMDTNTYNSLATALIVIIAGTCLAVCFLGCVGGLFLIGHLQRWQNARHAKRIETERP